MCLGPAVDLNRRYIYHLNFQRTKLFYFLRFEHLLPIFKYRQLVRTMRRLWAAAQRIPSRAVLRVVTASKRVR